MFLEAGRRGCLNTESLIIFKVIMPSLCHTTLNMPDLVKVMPSSWVDRDNIIIISAALDLCCSAQVSHCGGFSCCGTVVVASIVVVCGGDSCGSQAFRTQAQ